MEKWLRLKQPPFDISFEAAISSNHKSYVLSAGIEMRERVKVREDEEARVQASQEQEASRAREILKKEAIRVHGVEKGMLFINAAHPRISAKPYDFCKDQKSLDTCLSLLPGSTKSRRR